MNSPYNLVTGCYGKEVLENGTRKLYKGLRLQVVRVRKSRESKGKVVPVLNYIQNVRHIEEWRYKSTHS